MLTKVSAKKYQPGTPSQMTTWTRKMIFRTLNPNAYETQWMRISLGIVIIFSWSLDPWVVSLKTNSILLPKSQNFLSKRVILMLILLEILFYKLLKVLSQILKTGQSRPSHRNSAMFLRSPTSEIESRQ